MSSQITLSGQVERDVALLFVEQLAAFDRDDAPLTIDMEDADIEDGVVAAMLVEHIRQAAERVGAVRLLRPPQVLAHCLYRIGTLGPASAIQLIEPRAEIGT